MYEPLTETILILIGSAIGVWVGHLLYRRYGERAVHVLQRGLAWIRNLS